MALKLQKQSSTNTITIGIAGAGRRTGCTHLSLVIANILSDRGHEVALLERNRTNVFTNIAETEQISISQEGSFSLNNLDFYTGQNDNLLSIVMGRDYEYVIIDFGDYLDASFDYKLFSLSAKKIITCGSRPWEFAGMNILFDRTDNEILQSFYYCFMFTASNKAMQSEIKDALEGFNKIYFPPYSEDPFTSKDFDGIFDILSIAGIPQEDFSKKKKQQKGLFFKKKNRKEDQSSRNQATQPMPEQITIENEQVHSPVIYKENIKEVFDEVNTNEEMIVPTSSPAEVDDTSQNNRAILEEYEAKQIKQKQPVEPTIAKSIEPVIEPTIAKPIESEPIIAQKEPESTKASEKEKITKIAKNQIKEGTESKFMKSDKKGNLVKDVFNFARSSKRLQRPQSEDYYYIDKSMNKQLFNIAYNLKRLTKEEDNDTDLSNKYKYIASNYAFCACVRTGSEITKYKGDKDYYQITQKDGNDKTINIKMPMTFGLEILPGYINDDIYNKYNPEEE